MFFIILLFATAVFLSSVAAFYSIAGLISIFPTAVVPIAIMGIALELTKLVTASWLYRNWFTAPKSIKYYFTFAVLILSFITSMGIFGFLSKAHIDQGVTENTSIVQVKNLERQITSEENNIKNAQRSLDIMDRLVTDADPKDASFLRNRQKGEREALNNSIKLSSDKIKALNIELFPIRQESARAEAEVGPIKYVADLIYGESDKKLIEKAVRVVIMLIVFVFDPLAILLLIAANINLIEYNKHNKSHNIIKDIIVDKPAKKRGRPRKIKENIIEDNKEKWSEELYNYPTDNNIKIEKSRIQEIPREIFDKVFRK